MNHTDLRHYVRVYDAALQAGFCSQLIEIGRAHV